MLEFKSYGDIQRACEAGNAEPALLDLLQRRLSEVVAAFKEAEWDWDPEENGHFVVIEAGDDIRGLQEVGLNPEDNGLLGAIWEATFWHDGAGAWEVLVLYGNDTGMTFFVPDTPWVDPELRRMLAEEAEPWRDWPGSADGSAERAPF